MTEDLRQVDLSKLSLREMSPAQRAEMRRRLDVFVRAYAGRQPAAPQSKAEVRKWVPGMKT